jgi:glycerate 2-kinase
VKDGAPQNDDTARRFLLDLFEVAVASAQPSVVLARHLPAKPKGRCVVVGAGKASAAMAAALETAWPDVSMSGVVVTRYGHSASTQKIKIIEASHPVPDNNSVRAATEILDIVSGLTKDDLVIALISGGGSSLLVAPAAGLTLADKQWINRILLTCGASIEEMNTVRKHLSRVKGGKLAMAAAPAHVVTFLISDVPGDDPAIIASGPTVEDRTTAADALRILERYKVDVPNHIMDVFRAETSLKPNPSTEVHMIAAPVIALRAAAEFALSKGVTPIILGDALEGEAADVGIALSGVARSCSQHKVPASPPCVILSGGETTVTIGNKKPGKGGRNTELLLSTCLALNGAKSIWAFAGDTDGIDGSEDAAGALITPSSLLRAHDAGIDVRSFLETHNSYAFFHALGDLVITGPTLTNVNDFRALLVLPSKVDESPKANEPL